MLLFSFFALLVITFFVSLFLYEKSRVATIVTRLIFSVIAGSGISFLISFIIIVMLSESIRNNVPDAGAAAPGLMLIFIFPMIGIVGTIIISPLVFILNGRLLRLFFKENIKNPPAPKP